jgi:hypothetical protein
MVVGQPHGHTRILLRVCQLLFELHYAVAEQPEVRVVLVVTLLQLDGEEALVALQLGDLLLGVVVLALENVELGLGGL